MKWLFIALVRIYQILVSPWLGSPCRFHPSCSQYALDSLHKHGSLKGSWLAARRIVRCRPGVPGGYDPTP